MKRVLVTGAGGFIGSHLTEALLDKGYEVTAFVHYNSFHSTGWLDHLDRKRAKKIRFFWGDIRDPYGVRNALEDCGSVLHLAALIGIPYSYHSPETYVDTNIKGTLNVLQGSRDLGIEKIILTSTSEVYGTALTAPIREDHPLQGQSPYSATKIGADQLALSFHRSFGLPITILRPFNTYGPRQSARAVIPTIISQILSGKKEITLGSVHPTRDLVFVKDTVNGFVKALTTQEIEGEVIHLGTGFEISIGELAQSVAKLMNKEILIKQTEERIRPNKSEVEQLIADATKAERMLNWRPKHAGISGLEKGLLQTIDWFQSSKKQGYKILQDYVI